MKRLLLPLLAAIALPATVNAEVDPKVHKMCLPATDYIGCVKAQSGFINQTRITVDEGVALAEGNACPANMAYMGGGTCQRVKCDVGAFGIKFGKHDPLLAGKNWKCSGGGLLELGIATAKAFNNSSCPMEEPIAGWNNTCKQNGGEVGVDLVGANPDR
tara:strand:- start:2210 stop:2686 length:477 start_codon:yes stop_codon:yes gene_type:complete